MKKTFVLLAVLMPYALFGSTANVAVDYNSNVHAYTRNLAVGVNFLGEWNDLNNYKNNMYRFQQAGLRFLRFPGGSNSNEYHWNGNGAYDANKIWNVTGSPAVTAFSRGFYELAAHRGSLSKGYGKWAMVTDGDGTTSWLSYPDDDNVQWIYLDVETASYQPVPVTSIQIDWGNVYAAQYKIQYSNGNYNGMGQWAYNDTAWTDTSAGVLTGSGGNAVVNFNAVSAKYIRVYCLASSGAHNQFQINEIRLYNGATQITKNEADVNQTPSVSSSVALGDNFQGYDSMDFEEFISLARSMTPPAEPMVTINFFTGTTQEAADWVYYANIQQKYGVKYWEIGNENWGNWEAGGPICSESYAKRFLALYDAMTAVDPTIIIVPQFNYITDPENVTMNASNNPASSNYYIDDYLGYLQSHGRAGILQGVSIHRYPSFEPVAEATPLAMTDQWNTDMPKLKGWVSSRLTNPADVKVWLTEYNDGIDSGFTNHFYDALFVSGFFLNYLYNGGDQSCFFTSFGTPGPGQQDLSIFSDFGLMEGGGLSGALADKRNQPRASFYAFDMIYNDFSADDSFGNTLVSATSDNTMLKVYANKRGDDKLSLILVNIDPANTITASIALSNFTPLTSADMTTYGPQDYSWIANGAQSYASPDNPPEHATFYGASSNFACSVPPYSIRILSMYNSAQPTLIPSWTPTQLPTPTISPTPLPNGGSLVDDCEHAGSINLWGGSWSTYGDGKSIYPPSVSGMDCDGNGYKSTCYLNVTGTFVAGTGNYGFGVSCPLSISWVGMNVSQYDGVFFYYKGDGFTTRMYLNQAGYAGYDYYSADFNVNTYWTYCQAPFSSLKQGGWGTVNAFDSTKIEAISFQPDFSARNVSINIDNVGFYRNTPTATPTIVASGTAANLKNVQAWPSLCNMKDGCKGIKFVNLTKHTILKVFNINGGMIYKTEQDTPDGTLLWNLNVNKMEKKTAPGYYLYTLIDENKDSVTGKVAIIR